MPDRSKAEISGWVETSPGVYERQDQNEDAEDDKLWNRVPTALIDYAINNMRKDPRPAFLCPRYLQFGETWCVWPNCDCLIEKNDGFRCLIQ